MAHLGVGYLWLKGVHDCPWWVTSPGSVYIIVLMCGYPMLLMRGRRLTHLDAGSCNSFMHDRFDNGCWPGRWARWEMEGTLTKWSSYSLSGHRPWELFRSLLIRLSQKSKKYSLPVCVCVCPQLPAVVRVGWQGNPGGEQKAELPHRWTATINDLTNFPPWPWITLLQLWCRWHYPPIMTLSCNFSEVLLQKRWSVIGSQNPNWMIVPEMLWHRWSSKDWVRWREFKAGQSKAGSEVGPIRVDKSW